MLQLFWIYTILAHYCCPFDLKSARRLIDTHTHTHTHTHNVCMYVYVYAYVYIYDAVRKKRATASDMKGR